MVKTFTDRFGKVWDTQKLELFTHDTGKVTLQDGTYIVAYFCDLDDAADCLELNEHEIDFLERECHL